MQSTLARDGVWSAAGQLSVTPGPTHPVTRQSTASCHHCARVGYSAQSCPLIQAKFNNVDVDIVEKEKEHSVDDECFSRLYCGTVMEVQRNIFLFPLHMPVAVNPAYYA